MAMFWKEQGPVSGVSLLGMIDHRQNQQLSFVKASFLLPPLLAPFPCLLSHQDPCFCPPEKCLQPGKEMRPLALRLGSAHCQVPGETHLISPASLQAGLMLELKVLWQLLLFFKRKLGKGKEQLGEGRGQWGWHR